MRPLLQHIDRLQRLAVFDAAARCGSFTAAAAELGTTQPGVTRHISALERSLGVTLFERTANRSSLTDAGRALSSAVDVAFTGIERTLTSLTEPDATFVFASPPGFAQQLIVPMLDELHDAVNVEVEHDIRLWLYDHDGELDNAHADIMIRLGDGRWHGLDSVPLFREAVVPVATTAFAEEHGLHAGSTASEVMAAPLLHMDGMGRPWMSWADWLATFGLSLSSGGRRVLHNAYPTLVQQALAGRGIALGWRGIIDQYLDDGLLVTVGPDAVTDRYYCLAWPAGRRSPSVEAVIQWMSPDR
jgi:DNA-binding transcriptional LysR family regulator